MPTHTFADLFDEFQATQSLERKSRKTLQLNRDTALLFCQWADARSILPTELQPGQVTKYIGNLCKRNGEAYAVESLRAHAKRIQSLLTFGAEEGHLAKRIKVRMPKRENGRPDYYTEDQQAALLRLLAERLPPADLRLVAAVRLMIDSGLRIGEVVALNWSDLDWSHDDQQGTVHVREGKGDKFRESTFGRETWKALMALRRSYTEYGGKFSWANRLNAEGGWRGLYHFDGPVFFNFSQLGRLGIHGLALLIRKFGQDVGMPDLHAHKLRHTAIRNWIKAGLPLQAAMNQSGHSDLRMLQHYSTLVEEETRKLAADAMGRSRRLGSL